MKKIKFGLLILATVIFGSACNDYLDELPDNRTQIYDGEGLGKLLINAYPQGSHVYFTETMSDNVVDKTTNPILTTDVSKDAWQFTEIYHNQFQGSPDYYWSTCYDAISHANVAIEKYHDLNDPSLDSYLGEALIARAYTHFMLVNLFAKPYDNATATTDLGVPYVTEVEKVLHKSYHRSTVKEVYDLIIKDFEEGYKLLDDSRYDVPKYHWTEAAAQAFGIRLYLYRNSAVTDLDRALFFASKLFTKDDTGLLRDWNGFYETAGYYEKQAQYTLSSEKPNLLLTHIKGRWGYYYPFERYNMSLNKLGEIIDNARVKSNLVFPEIAHGDERTFNVPKYKNYKIQDDPTSPSFIASWTQALFTGEEAFYNMIEAKIRKDLIADAIYDLNTILSTILIDYDATEHTIEPEHLMDFYGEDEKTSCLKFLIALKRFSTVHEGLRWFDIRRFDIPVIHMNEDGTKFELTAKDPRKVIQIPESAQAYGVKPNIY